MRLHIASIVAVAIATLSSAAQQGVTTRVNVDSSGAQAENGYSIRAAISGTGRFVVFGSRANNLVPGDTNAQADFFVHDIQTGATTRVSVDSLGAQADQNVLLPFGPAISSDGRYSAFVSRATNLVPSDTNAVGDVFVHDLQSGITERVSVSSAGVEGDYSSDVGPVGFSSDGRYVVFSSWATNLVVGDLNNARDVFVRDRTLNKTYRVSVDINGVEGFRDSLGGTLSGDGRFVAFQSDSTLVPADVNGTGDVYVFDFQSAIPTLASVGTSGVQGNGYSENPWISTDGRYVAFDSRAWNLVTGDSNGTYDVFVRDLTLGVTSRISVSSFGVQGMGASRFPSISADGRFVAFDSFATNLVADDTNGLNGVDTFLHDRLTHTTWRTSVDSAGAQADGLWSVVSADGRRVVFESGATNVVPNDTNGFSDIFLREILCGPPANYCEAGLSTNFCSPTMSATGTASASAASGFTLTCSGLEGLKSGLIFYGINGRLAQPWGPIGGSIKCVKPPTQRTPIQNSGGTDTYCDGSISIDWLAFVASHPAALGLPLTPGAIIDAQCWYRDPPAPKGTNLSSAIEFELCP